MAKSSNRLRWLSKFRLSNSKAEEDRSRGRAPDLHDGKSNSRLRNVSEKEKKVHLKRTNESNDRNDEGISKKRNSCSGVDYLDSSSGRHSWDALLPKRNSVQEDPWSKKEKGNTSGDCLNSGWQKERKATHEKHRFSSDDVWNSGWQKQQNAEEGKATHEKHRFSSDDGWNSGGQKQQNAEEGKAIHQKHSFSTDCGNSGWQKERNADEGKATHEKQRFSTDDRWNSCGQKEQNADERKAIHEKHHLSTDERWNSGWQKEQNADEGKATHEKHSTDDSWNSGWQKEQKQNADEGKATHEKHSTDDSWNSGWQKEQKQNADEGKATHEKHRFSTDDRWNSCLQKEENADEGKATHEKQRFSTNDRWNSCWQNEQNADEGKTSHEKHRFSTDDRWNSCWQKEQNADEGKATQEKHRFSSDDCWNSHSSWRSCDPRRQKEAKTEERKDIHEKMVSPRDNRKSHSRRDSSVQHSWDYKLQKGNDRGTRAAHGEKTYTSIDDAAFPPNEPVLELVGVGQRTNEQARDRVEERVAVLINQSTTQVPDIDIAFPKDFNASMLQNLVGHSTCSPSSCTKHSAITSNSTSVSPNSSKCDETTHENHLNTLHRIIAAPQNYPAKRAIWKGRFKVTDVKSVVKVFEDFSAHPSFKVCRRVYEFSKKMSSTMEFLVHPRSTYWPKVFEECPDTNDVALYFYPRNYDASSNYSWLLRFIDKRDLMLRSKMGQVELLVFSSRWLDAKCRTLNNNYFFWGVFTFKGKKSKEKK